MGAPGNQTLVILSIAAATCGAIILFVLDGGSSSIVVGASETTPPADLAPMRPAGLVATGVPGEAQLAQAPVNPLPKIDLPTVTVPGVSRIEGGGEPDEEEVIPEEPVAPLAPGLGTTEGLKPSISGGLPTPPILPAKPLPEVTVSPRKVEIPAPVSLPPPESERCEKAMKIYEARLRSRERAMDEARIALDAEKDRVQSVQAVVEDRWKAALDTWDVARILGDRAAENCAGSPPPPGSLRGIDLGLDKVSAEDRVAQVVQIIKAMKPKAAARVIERWKHPLATTALSRLSPRVSSKIMAALPEDVARRLTVDLIRGKGLKSTE
jgi:flagellar motility protein MotE (MotC chaperone)